MGYPTRYATFRDKYDFVEPVSFGSTCTDLLEKLQQLSNEGYLFRGQRDALWPIVSSGQRTFVEYSKYTSFLSLTYIDFLTRALAYAKREGKFVPNKTTSGRRCLYDHEIWGWLQHYSYFSPLIDFSRDPMVALYMATAHIVDFSDDGYFSIYAIEGHYETSRNENVRLETLIKENETVLKTCSLTKEQMFGFDNWKEFGFCLIHKDGSLKPWDKSLARARIASQNGLFVYLNDASVSLELYYKRQSEMLYGGEGVGCILSRIKCIDVPNSIVPLVVELCRRDGYTAESLGLADQRNDTFLKIIKSNFLEALKRSK